MNDHGTLSSASSSTVVPSEPVNAPVIKGDILDLLSRLSRYTRHHDNESLEEDMSDTTCKMNNVGDIDHHFGSFGEEIQTTFDDCSDDDGQEDETTNNQEESIGNEEEETIYHGHHLLLKNSMMLILLYSVTYSITGEQLSSLLTLLSLHCMQQPSALYRSVAIFN